MKNKNFIILFISAMAYIGCTSHNMQELYPSGGCIGDTLQVVSFSKNIIPIFEKNCSISGCHTGNNPEGNLNLDAAVAYINLMKKSTGYIDTNNATSSLLYRQLNSASDPMPPTGRLDDCDINLVLKWIQQKAMNN